MNDRFPDEISPADNLWAINLNDYDLTVGTLGHKSLKIAKHLTKGG